MHSKLRLFELKNINFETKKTIIFFIKLTKIYRWRILDSWQILDFLLYIYNVPKLKEAFFLETIRKCEVLNVPIQNRKLDK